MRDNHSDVCMAKTNYSNTETLSMVLEGLEKLYQKSDHSRQGDDPKVSKTGLTFPRTILVIAGTAATLSPLNGHRLIIFCLTNFRSRSIMLHTIARSSKSLETFLQGKRLLHHGETMRRRTNDAKSCRRSRKHDQRRRAHGLISKALF